MFDKATRVLIVDDASTMRFLTKKLLKSMGFENIHEAADGTQAWQLISESGSNIGMIISDWNMPVSNGLDLLKRLRSDSVHGKIPFLMLTAESDKDQVISAVQAGADSYIIKPINATVLSEKIESLFKKRQAA